MSWAQKTVAFLESSPKIKLLLIAYALVQGIATPGWLAYSEFRAARRAGVAEEPPVSLGVTTDRCSLRNMGPRPIREATLAWHFYTVVVEPCAIISSLRG